MTSSAPAKQTVSIAVCGLHMSNQPLNYQLTEAGATLQRSCSTDSIYKLYAISFPEHMPTRPGLLRVEGAAGHSFPLEVWDVPADKVGLLLLKVTEPLALGRVQLSDKTSVFGFICEGFIANRKEAVQDISNSGGWLAFMNQTG